MRKRPYIILLLALTTLLLFTTCASRKYIRTSPLTALKKRTEKDALYYLPISRITVSITAVVTRVIPGPYNSYAQSLLGISPPTDENKPYRILSAGLSVADLPDMRIPFVATLLHENLGRVFPETIDGGLIPAEQTSNVLNRSISAEIPRLSSPALLTDLSSTPFEQTRNKTIYTTVQRDSATVTIPVSKPVMQRSTEAEKAKQAAENIFTLRQRRYDLINGDIEVPTSPDAVSALIALIDRMEKELLTLFVGQTLVDTIREQWQVQPTRKAEEISLGRFSETYGFLPISAKRGEPITLHVTIPGELPSIPKSPIENAYYYRTAYLSDATLSIGDQTILNSTLPIRQFGEIATFPFSSANFYYK